MNYSTLTTSAPDFPGNDSVAYLDGAFDATLPNVPGRFYHVASNDGGARILAPSGGTIKLGAASCGAIHTTESDTLLTLACIADGVWSAPASGTWEEATW